MSSPPPGVDGADPTDPTDPAAPPEDVTARALSDATAGISTTADALLCPATPGFNINGVTPPADGSPIASCASHIILNAGATTCESKYNIGVQESDRWWNRSYQYEWGRWFNGAAPDGLNLQQLSTTYSYPPDYPSGVSPRQGSPLIGGFLSPGVQRYFRVSVCTGEPTWTCLTALLQVDGGC